MERTFRRKEQEPLSQARNQVCAWCKRVRDEQGEWQMLEAYIHDRSEADFTHGMCPDCARELVN